MALAAPLHVSPCKRGSGWQLDQNTGNMTLSLLCSDRKLLAPDMDANAEEKHQEPLVEGADTMGCLLRSNFKLLAPATYANAEEKYQELLERLLAEGPRWELPRP